MLKYPWKSIADHGIPEHKTFGEFEPGSLVVLCGGFEDRCEWFLEHTDRADCSNAYLIEYLPKVEGNRHELMQSKLNALGVECERFVYDRTNPEGAVEGLIQALKKTSTRIYVDISGMSRLLITQLICQADAVGLLSRVTITYCEADFYPPKKDDAKNQMEKVQESDGVYRPIFLSTGVCEVLTIAELTSTQMGSDPKRLVCFPGFSSDQFIETRTAISPAYLEIINGRPPKSELDWRIDAIREINGLDSLGRNATEHTISTLDYRDTFWKLLEIYERQSHLNKIIIAPTGSKMQTVAVAAFRCCFPDVQISYPVPRVFCAPRSYTEGVGRVWSLDLGFISDLRSSINS